MQNHNYGWIDAYLRRNMRREAIRHLFGPKRIFSMHRGHGFGEGNLIKFCFRYRVLFSRRMPDWFVHRFTRPCYFHVD